MGQSIRPSQFITTYGPGSILEGEKGPRIILSLEQSGLFEAGRTPREFEISDQRFSQSLLEGQRIVRIPSNAELRVAEEIEVYKTRQFPNWSLCIDHNIIYRYNHDTKRGCPRCTRSANHYEEWLKSRREAIRFIFACEEGHINDVDWIRLVRHRSTTCRPSYMLWVGGGSLRDVKIQCPNCSAEENLGIAYGKDHYCSGRLPEISSSNSPCDCPAKIIQRGAANLRVPEILTSLTIPPKSKELHELLGRQDVTAALFGRNLNSKDEIITLLEEFASRRLVAPDVVAILKQYDEAPILQALEEVRADEQPKTIYEYKVDELKALQRAATFGEPLQPSSTPGAPPRFEVNVNDVKFIRCENGNTLRITPVSRLRVVAVQKGYRRLNISGSHVNSVALDDEGALWYPGVELHGEGVFIDLKPFQETETYINHFNLSGAAYEEWLYAYNNQAEGDYSDKLSDLNYLHPVFIWWHTLAHRIITALSVDSGYSSAAISERIYVDINDNGIAGGILLYAAQPGGDGTLGGLIALVPRFKRVLDAALRDIFTCSNDPLCSEHEFRFGKYNGAACYACQLISETSCQHRNMLLDRNILVGNLP